MLTRDFRTSAVYVPGSASAEKMYAGPRGVGSRLSPPLSELGDNSVHSLGGRERGAARWGRIAIRPTGSVRLLVRDGW